ncbi:MAG: hypothetical protein ACM3VV_04235 [Deltaproteobacteria bacterium]
MNNNNSNDDDSNREKLAAILKLMEKEGDRKEFEYNGYKCLILRNSFTSSGHLNGYVLVPRGHILYGKDYNDIEKKYEINIHGGLTYSDFGHFIGEYFPSFATDINNKEEDKEEYWLIGFDTAHAYDMQPLQYVRDPELIDRFGMLFESETYKDMEYVTNECKNLVDQIIKISSSSSS